MNDIRIAPKSTSHNKNESHVFVTISKNISNVDISCLFDLLCVGVVRLGRTVVGSKVYIQIHRSIVDLKKRAK